MRCAEVRDLLQPFLDGELEVERSVVMLKHLELCPPCHERVECEKRLHALVAPACCEALCAQEKQELLAACYARCAEADGECSAGGDGAPRPRRLRWLAAAALLVGVAGGLASLPHARCFWRCPKTRIMEVAHQQSQLLPPLPIDSDALRTCMVQAHTSPPAIEPLELKGGTPLLLAEGQGEIPLFRYACKCDGSEVVVFRLPDAHFHSWQRTDEYDGLEYIKFTTDAGVRVLGWNDGRGGLWCMMGRAERVPYDRLVAVASPLRRRGP